MVLLRDEWYHEAQGEHMSLKQLVARVAVKHMRLHDIATPSELGPVHGGSGGSSGLQDDEIIEYLLSRPMADSPLGQQCCALKAYELQMLNLAHDFLNTFLPHALKKIDRVTFGIMSDADVHYARKANPFMPLSRAKLAVPFVSKDVPSPSSEFAQPGPSQPRPRAAAVLSHGVELCACPHWRLLTANSP